MRLTRLALAATLCLTAPTLGLAADPSPAPATPAAAAPDQGPPPTPEEAARRDALNKQEAERAQQQVDENTARVMTNADEARKHAEAVKAYEAAKAQYDAQVKAYEAAMVKWQADVAACKAGDLTRCAQPAVKP